MTSSIVGTSPCSGRVTTEGERRFSAYCGSSVMPPVDATTDVAGTAMEFVPLDRILTSIRDGLHRLTCPASEPATSLREPRLLKRIAQDYCHFVLVPTMVGGCDKAAANSP